MVKLNLEKAKELFFKYNGSHFQMEREGDYSIYKNYKVSKDQEYIWVKEIETSIFYKIKTVDDATDFLIDLSRIISEYRDVDGLELMINIANDNKDIKDSFFKIILAEQLIDIVESFKKVSECNKKIISNIMLMIDYILQSVLDSPIVIEKKYIDLGYLDDILKEEELISRTKENIELCMNLNNYLHDME